MAKIKNLLPRILFWFVATTVFLGLTVFVLLGAAGYRVNWQRLKLQKTSLVWVKTPLKDINLYMDGKLISGKSPVRIKYVQIGWKEIKIEKAGYHTWKRNIFTDPGKAYELRDIVLFKNNVEPKVVEDPDVIRSLEGVFSSPNITVMNGEMRANDALVSRFFRDPSFYSWYDGYHILFQVGDEIRAIDTNGLNDNLIVKLSSEEPTVFKVIKGGKSLLYRDGNGVKEVVIR